MTQTERWAQQLVKSTSGFKPYLDVDGYCVGCSRLVEPYLGTPHTKDSTAYADFCEHNPDNWAMFIKTVLGTEWFDIACIINEEGY